MGSSLALQWVEITEAQRAKLAQDCLVSGHSATPKQLSALAQAKIAYVNDVFKLCVSHDCKAFASIVSKTAHPYDGVGFFRTDYVCLLERFFYFLEDTNTCESGIHHFKYTEQGRMRASQIIPEPFFVRSDLTTGVQIADILAYVISWGLRIGDMEEPVRTELDQLARLADALEYTAERPARGRPRNALRSFIFLSDLG